MKNVLIGQSGGPSAVINASLAGAVRAARQSKAVGRVYGALNGIEGFLQRRVVDLGAQLPAEEALARLCATPAMALGSCRRKLPAPPHEVYGQILALFKEYNIGYFFYIGGNDSMDTVDKIAAFLAAQGEEIRCIGIPKTIDNDLAETDHTPGFGSAANFIANTMAQIICDSSVYNRPSATIVEIMGRNAGWLTAAAALAGEKSGGQGPHLVFLPEVSFGVEAFLQKVRAEQAKHQNVVVAVSEGVRTAEGAYVGEMQGSAQDDFGHGTLGGVGQVLENLVREKIGCKVRGINLNVLQRAAGHFASATDLAEAEAVGAEGVRLALAGETGKMVAIRRVSNSPYAVEYTGVEVSRVANKERKVPLEWIGEAAVLPPLLAYLRPLMVDLPALPRCGYFYVDRQRLVQP